MAITISIDQVRGVAGLLVPGDFVNMMVVGTGAGEATGGRPPAPRGRRDVFTAPARYLYQKVQILAIGQTRKLEPGETAATNADGTPVSSTTSGLLTFALPAAGRPADRVGRGRRLLPHPRAQGLPAHAAAGRST